MPAENARLAGPLLFARYAYPPNSLGFCGPADSAALREYGAAGVVDAGLVELARSFSGAWPYLELIAGACGIADPLDHRVVEAYWVGNGLLETIPLRRTADSLEERFRSRVGGQFTYLVDGVLAGGVPHHSFHVFGVYPWVGLLGDDRKTDQALTVLDRCRIRWGKVVSASDGEVAVMTRRLQWDGRALRLGDMEPETARCHRGAGGLDLAEGDWVSLHWDWVCDRLSRPALSTLQRYSRHHLDLVNHRVPRPGTLVALGGG